MNYDDAGRIKTIDHGPSRYETTFDAAGLLTDWTSAADPLSSFREVTYTHDRRGQINDVDVTRVSGGFRGESDYDFDDGGNRTGTAPDDDNRISRDRFGNVSYRYDPEGNRIQERNDSTTVYTDYDHRNRLVRWENVGGAGGRVSYTYDESNHLIARTQSGSRDFAQNTTERYVRDGDQTVLADREGTLDDAAYLWGDRIDQLLAITELDATTGDVAATFWTLTDHLGSVRGHVDASTGVLLDHVDYTAFGTETNRANAEPIDAMMDYGYTARPTDTQTRLQNNRNRWYDADEGRWISQDPIGFEAGDANLYRYVNNSALTMIDPLGLERQPTLTSEEAEKLHKDLKEYAKLANLGAGFYGKGLGASNFLNYLNGRGTCVYAGPDKLSEQQIKRLVELAMRSIFNGPIPGQTTSDSNGVHIHPYKFLDGDLGVAVGGTHDVYAIPKNCQMQSGGFAPRGSIDLHFDIFDIYDFHRNDLNIELWGSSRFTGRQTDYFKDSEMLDLECHGFAKRFEFHLKFKIPVKFVLDANNRLVSITTGKAESWVR